MIQEEENAPAVSTPNTQSGDVEKNLKSSTPPTKSEDDDEKYLVHLEGQEDPKNWSNAKKWYLTMTAGFLVLNATFSSSAPSGVLQGVMEELQFGEEVATLTIAIFVAGYCIGPLLWGPLSENYGRRNIFIFSGFIYWIFQMATALSPNTAAILLFRFFGGTFAASPLTNSGALISDIWDAEHRGTALAAFTLAPFAGPALGPVVAGYITVSGTNWRVLFWVLFAFAGFCLFQIILTIPETYGPVLAERKAARLRKETGNDKWYALHERAPKQSWAHKAESIVARPFKMLAYEPMLLAVTLYMSFVYGVIYLLFEAIPIVFTEGHGFNEGSTGLVYLPLPIGGIVACLCYIWYYNPRYVKEVHKAAPKSVPPEVRLEMAMASAPLLVISLFWFAWTSFPSVSYWAPLVAIGVLGCGVCFVFLSLFTYIIDVYLYAAASALAGSTVVRSLFGAAFPLFATQMYERLGTQWAGALLGFIALLLAPIPFVLVKFGPYLRSRSKYSPAKPEDEDGADPTEAQEEREMEALDAEAEKKA